MRILHLTPGTGTFHCGSCLRDNALIKALRARGHDAIMVPLYLPLVTDREEASPRQPVRVGGISLYLQQRYDWFHRLPTWFHRWLNQPAFLRKAAARMGMTSAAVLGEMAVGSLKGQEGRQWAEWKKLVDWMVREVKPDVVSLSNSLLSGLAPAIRQELGVPVVCSLQGEDSFLDTLEDPWKQQAWEALRKNAGSVDRFIAPSVFYQKVMAERLGVSLDKVTVVSNGLDATSFPVADPDPNWPTIGYLARMIEGKGLGMVVDAFIKLSQREQVARVRLRIGGALTPIDEAYVGLQKEKIEQAGLAKRVEWMPNLSYEEKLKFLGGLTVFSVPATYGEAFGLYVLEAMACGVPVVQPEHGAFPELIEATGGGVLCKADDAGALAEALGDLLMDSERCDQFANRGMAAVRRDFTSGRMAERFDEMLGGLKAGG